MLDNNKDEGTRNTTLVLGGVLMALLFSLAFYVPRQPIKSTAAKPVDDDWQQLSQKEYREIIERHLKDNLPKPKVRPQGDLKRFFGPSVLEDKQEIEQALARLGEIDRQYDEDEKSFRQGMETFRERTKLLSLPDDVKTAALQLSAQPEEMYCGFVRRRRAMVNEEIKKLEICREHFGRYKVSDSGVEFAADEITAEYNGHLNRVTALIEEEKEFFKEKPKLNINL